MIKLTMSKKSLKETNPYLKDYELGKALIKLSVASSTAVEGVLTKYPKLSKEKKKRLREIAAPQKAQKKAIKCSWPLSILPRFINSFGYILMSPFYNRKAKLFKGSW